MRTGWSMLRPKRGACLAKKASMSRKSSRVSPATYRAVTGLSSAGMGKRPTHSGLFQLVAPVRSCQARTATNSRISSRRRIRTCFHTGAAQVLEHSRLQSGRGPGTGIEGARGRGAQRPAPASPVVDAGFAFDPQLQFLDPQLVSAPMRRTGNGDLRIVLRAAVVRGRSAEAFGHHQQGLPQVLARSHGLALRASPGSQAALPGSRGKVGVAVGRGGLDDRTLDPYLPMQSVPMDDSRGPGIALDLLTFKRAVIGVEHQISGVG